MKSSGYFVVLLKESCLVGGNITDYSCFFYLPITFFLRAAAHLTIKQAWLVLSQRNWQVSFPGCLNYSLLSLFCFTFDHLASAQILILKNCIWSPFFSKHLGSEQRHRFALFSSECSLISSSPVCSQSLDAELCGRSQVCFFSPSENKVYWLIFYILSAFSVWYSIDSCIVTIIGAFYHIFHFLL